MYFLLIANGGPEGIYEFDSRVAAESFGQSKGGTVRQLGPDEEAVYRRAQVKVISQVGFLRRFTQAERIAIRSASKVNPIVEDFQYMLELATSGIDVTDGDVKAGIEMLVSVGILSPARAATILSA